MNRGKPERHNFMDYSICSPRIAFGGSVDDPLRYISLQSVSLASYISITGLHAPDGLWVAVPPVTNVDDSNDAQHLT